MAPVSSRSPYTVYLYITLSCSWIPAASVSAEPLPPQRQSELIDMIRQDCGSCHGLLLKGGLGPPLTRAALSDKPPELLFNTILLGRDHTAMPPWQSLLSRQEIDWLVQQLKTGLEEPGSTSHE